MIIIVDSKEHADKYVKAGLIDELKEIERSGICVTPEQLEASWWKGGNDARQDERQGDADAAEGGTGA